MSFVRSLSLLSPLLGAAVALGAENSAPPGHDHEEPVALDQLVVTGSAFAKAQADLAQSTAVLTGRTLAFRQNGSLGETLAGETGIATTYFGPGASRPVIRGIGGDRVRVLENGLGTFDVSNVSPDHATSLEPLFVERIEVVRGPATLLHGNAAIGGVVNTFDGRIPETRTDAAFRGLAEIRVGGAADERAGAVKAQGDSGAFTWQARAFRRRTSDTSIDGDNFSPALGVPVDDLNRRDGSIPNSSLTSDGGSFGGSWFGREIRVGAAFTGYQTDYGIPLVPSAVDEEGPVRIGLRQRRFDASADLTRPFGIFSGAKIDAGGARYSHTEFADGEPGTRFIQRANEARLALPHRAFGQLTGEFGAQYQFTNLHAEGDEAFLPPVKTTNLAAFMSEELAVGAVTFQGGARLERQRETPAAASGLPARSFTPASVSLGAVWSWSADWGLAVSAAQTHRAPSATELFADGPHAGTQAYEVGDPALGNERARSLEISLRRRAGFVTGAASVFTNQFSNYVFEHRTGAIADGFPEYRFIARRVNFAGGEIETWWHLHERGGRGLDLKLAADFVRATERSSHEPLPRIPAARVLTGLRYTYGAFSGQLGVTRSFAQRRTAPEETPTAAFTLLDLDVSWRFGRDAARTESANQPAARRERLLFLRGTNLTDATARNHASFLKEIAPLPGRGVTLGVRAEF